MRRWLVSTGPLAAFHVRRTMAVAVAATAVAPAVATAVAMAAAVRVIAQARAPTARPAAAAVDIAAEREVVTAGAARVGTARTSALTRAHANTRDRSANTANTASTSTAASTAAVAARRNAAARGARGTETGTAQRAEPVPSTRAHGGDSQHRPAFAAAAVADSRARQQGGARFECTRSRRLRSMHSNGIHTFVCTKLRAIRIIHLYTKATIVLCIVCGHISTFLLQLGPRILCSAPHACCTAVLYRPSS